MAASAAGMAFGWNESGWFFQTIFTLLPYCSRTCLSVGSTREQNGHWKSLHTAMVTGAPLGPSMGAAPTSMATFSVGTAGAAMAGGGAAGAALTFSATMTSY